MRKHGKHLFTILFFFSFLLLTGQEKTNVKQLRLLFDQARSYLPNQPQKADSLAQVLLSMAMQQKGNGDSVLARVYYLLGITSYFRSNTLLAATYYRKALETDFASRDLTIRESCLNNLGVVYDLEGNLAEATSVYMQSLKIAEQRKDSASMVHSWINLSLIDRKMGSYSRGLETCRKAVEFSSRKKDTTNLGLGLQNMGSIYSEMGEYEKARFHLRRAVALFRQQKKYFYLKDVLVDIADVELEDRRYDEAETYLKEAMKSMEGNQPDENALPVLIKYGELMMARGNLNQAKMYLSRAEKMAATVQRNEYLASIYYQLASVYAWEGNIARYDEVIQKYREVMDSQLKAKLTSTYDQLRNFYEIDLLNREKIQLEEGIKNRNRQLVFTWVALLIILAAGAVIVVQNIKLNRFVRTLFRLNVEEFRQYVQADHPTYVGKEAVDLTQSKELSTLPSFDRYQSIINILESEKLYLSPDFTLQELSTRLASNQKYISQAINEHSGTNFNGLANRYRVQEARKLILSSPVDQAINLNDVAFRSGFNNRVSFYRNFKEETGFTPSEFLKMSKSKVLGS